MKKVKDFLKRLWHDERSEFSKEVSHKEKTTLKLETDAKFANFYQL